MKKTPFFNCLLIIYLVFCDMKKATTVSVTQHNKATYTCSNCTFFHRSSFQRIPPSREFLGIHARLYTTNLGHTDDFNVDKLRGRRSRPERVLFTLDHSAGDGGGTFRINHRQRRSFRHSAAYRTGRRETGRACWAQTTPCRRGPCSGSRQNVGPPPGIVTGIGQSMSGSKCWKPSI